MRNAIVTLALLLAASCPPVGTASPFDANLARDVSAFDLGQSADVSGGADATAPADAASRDRSADGGAADHTATDRATADTATAAPDRNTADTGTAGGSDAGTGAECDDDVDCGDGRGCLNGICHDNCLLGLYCPESSGVACVQGVCVECRDDADCPGTRYACDPASYSCRDRAFDPSLTKFGIFYHTWHCRVPRTGTVPDLSEVLAGRRNFDPDYDTVYWWDQPAAGYYCLSENDALLRTHAERLRDAGIDFVFLDVTNHNYVGAGSDDTPGMILEPLDRLLAVWSTVTGAPKVSAWVPVEQATEDARRYTVDAINARLANYPALRFIYRGKPLLLITENSEHPVNATRVAQLAQDYTVRHMWAHATLQSYYRPELWSFMNACDNDPTSGERCLQYSATLDGAIEQITVVTSYQMTFANLPTAVPKHHGLTFRKQFETALDNPQAPIVTITGWNEWQGRRTPCGVADCDCATYPQGCFVDMYDVERSRDIEDGQNEMGDFYYRLLRACIALFRQGARCDAAHAADLCCGGT